MELSREEYQYIMNYVSTTTLSDSIMSVIDVVLTGVWGFMKAGKSTVFQKMFDINLKEMESGTVTVHKADAPALRSMVNFCYTAEILFTEEAPVEEVLKVAHRFDIIELKEVCESELCKGINRENLCTRLYLPTNMMPRR
ncbi:hypothetical protein AXG93_2018s1430 [Marchantia polymorpha subsp. ruderalis]|uniref:BTB domain-containing protein n=1 Tax=Marchantia polymorpha subsp. ruderalis TaxID=1480154 RepID=A0A176WFS6_MARPO|nr:hypothetical protein AXG93_2018s1430 [Marchantia polymorpha subsp. ruderalis]